MQVNREGNTSFYYIFLHCFSLFYTFAYILEVVGISETFLEKIVNWSVLVVVFKVSSKNRNI